MIWVWYGIVWNSKVQYGLQYNSIVDSMVWYTTDGMVYAMIGYGMGLVWYPFYYSIVQYGIVQCGYGMIWYGMVGYDIV